MKKILFIIGLMILWNNAGSSSNAKEPIIKRDYNKSVAELSKEIDSLAVQIRLRLDLLNYENDENTAYYEEQY